MNGRQRLLAVVAALATALVPGGCAEETTSPAIVVSGHVEATEIRVATKIGGTLEAFPVEEGDLLERGQEIAGIDTVDLDLALDAAAAERRLAESELRLLLAGYRQEEIAEARAQVERAAAELEAAEKDLARFEALLDRGSGTEKARDDALARTRIARETREAARARLAKLEAGFREEEIDTARARVAAAESRIARIRQRIEDATVSSPVRGRVTEKLVEAGEVLAPGTPLLIAIDLDGAWLTAYLNEPDLGRIRLGQEVTVVTDDGQRRPGRITFVADEAEFTPKNVQTRDERVELVYRIKVDLDNADEMYKPGMPAEAHIEPVSGMPEGGRTGRSEGEPARSREGGSR